MSLPRKRESLCFSNLQIITPREAYLVCGLEARGPSIPAGADDYCDFGRDTGTAGFQPAHIVQRHHFSRKSTPRGDALG